tara:strand:- start:146 stop:481 length:336 start_codon:yes stop_codon:yes gene_type:complete
MLYPSSLIFSVTIFKAASLLSYDEATQLLAKDAILVESEFDVQDAKINISATKKGLIIFVFILIYFKISLNTNIIKKTFNIECKHCGYQNKKRGLEVAELKEEEGLVIIAI